MFLARKFSCSAIKASRVCFFQSKRCVSSFDKALDDFQSNFNKFDHSNVQEPWKKRLQDGLTLVNLLNDIAINEKEHRRNEWFILDGENQIKKAENVEDGEKFYASKLARHVDHDTVGPFHVDTMFLSIDHRFGGVPGDRPILFETMVFGEKTKGGENEALYCERCCTWDEAVAMHTRVCMQIRNNYLPQVNEFGKIPVDFTPPQEEQDGKLEIKALANLLKAGAWKVLPVETDGDDAEDEDVNK